MKSKKEIKKLGKLKLNQFSKTDLDERAMCLLKGGSSGAPGCSCGGTDYPRSYWKA
nr:TIGR04149 family rSAM-modified RiPP [uncultured Macellibacteroides sp.]